MKDYISYIKEFHEGNQLEIDFIDNQLAKHLLTEQENQDEIEQILDYLYSKNPKIENIGYKTILSKTKKRHKQLQSISIKDSEKQGIDYDIILDFKDGFKFVKLISKSCYEREGRLMSHCVSSYYGRNSKIYSLRDKGNKPHCTIEEGQQIKGKGNGKIDPKYVDYVVKFLEKLGMKVGENEMKNLGYYKLSSIDEGLECKKLYNGYVYENNLQEIKDKDGDIYKGFGILNIKNLIDFDMNMKFNINIDIKSTVNYFVSKLKNITKDIAGSGDYQQIAGSGYNQKIAGSGYNQKIAGSGNYQKIAGSGNYQKIAGSGNYQKIAGSGYYQQIAGSGYYQQIAGSGDYQQIAGSGDCQQIAGSGNYQKIAGSGNCQKIDIQGQKSVGAAIGYKGEIRGIKGTWITLAEYDNDGKIYYVKSAQIDGKKIKENVWYKLENKKFVEVK